MNSIESKKAGSIQPAPYYVSRSENFWSRSAEAFLQLLFPMGTYCLCCGKYISGDRSYCICDHCIKHIRWGHVFIDLDEEAAKLGRPRVLDSARACMKYGLYERRLIFDLKYDGLTYVSRAIARIMADRVASDEEAMAQLSRADYIVSVPVHRQRLKKRGFNQAEKMASHLAAWLRIPHLPDCLVREKATAAQRSLSAMERFENMQQAFSLKPEKEKLIKGKRIILVDDVYTSGATAYHCARVLKEAGAGEVHFLSLATSNDFAEGYFSA